MKQVFSDLAVEDHEKYIEEKRLEAFVTYTQTPFVWAVTAMRHKRAADIIYEAAHIQYQAERNPLPIPDNIVREASLNQMVTSVTLAADAFLLNGYALECLFKGCLVTRIAEVIKDGKDGKSLSKEIAHHDLVKLCDQCKMPVSDDEKWALKILTRQIVWEKYPAPKNAKAMFSPVEPLFRELDVRQVGDPFTDHRLHNLCNRLFEKAYELTKPVTKPE